MRDDDFAGEYGEDIEATALSSLHERTPADIERQMLALSVASSVDEMCGGICASDWLMSRARAIHRLKNEIGVNWIEHNGEFDLGHAHYSVGYAYVVKCRDVAQAGHAVLAAAGGDFDQLLATLVSQPFKHASVRSLIGATLHGQLFDARRTGRLVNGVPERILKRVDTRFAR
jgi:hypothetical protein